MEIPSKSKSPWISEKQVSLDLIENHWKPVQHADDIQNMLEVFERVEEHALANHCSDLKDDEKLPFIKRENLDIEALRTFCKILGAGDEGSEDFIENHIILSASNPREYVQRTRIIKSMTIDDCKSFSWRIILNSNISYFTSKNYICALDWKSKAVDISWNINTLGSARKLKKFNKIKILGEKDAHSTENYLEQAAQILSKSKIAVAIIDSPGDSYLLTLLENKQVQAFVEAGQALGLDCRALMAPKKKGWDP